MAQVVVHRLFAFPQMSAALLLLDTGRPAWQRGHSGSRPLAAGRCPVGVDPGRPGRSRHRAKPGPSADRSPALAALRACRHPAQRPAEPGATLAGGAVELWSEIVADRVHRRRGPRLARLGTRCRSRTGTAEFSDNPIGWYPGPTAQAAGLGGAAQPADPPTARCAASSCRHILFGPSSLRALGRRGAATPDQRCGADRCRG